MAVAFVLRILLILVGCFLLGGLPASAWITFLLTGKRLRRLGTGNVGVQAAFYHGGRIPGILSVVAEAGKGIVAVLVMQAVLPEEPAWELVALVAVVLGRYILGRGAGTTNIVWGLVLHEPIAAMFVFLIGGTSFTILRERQQGRLAVVVLYPIVLGLLHPVEVFRVLAAIALSALIAWIYTRIPDDLNLSAYGAHQESQRMFRFFQGDRAVVTLDRPLDPRKVGQKAASLSQLRAWGYPVPDGWVLPPGDDAAPLVALLSPSVQEPLVVRSSAIGEDSEQASAAGQYQTFLHVGDREALQQAIDDCLASYDRPSAQVYRRDSRLPEDAMAVIVQRQILGVFSGVAFSRDPVRRQGDTVLVEALPGDATRVVSGRVTPERYWVYDLDESAHLKADSSADGIPTWLLPEEVSFPVEADVQSDPQPEKTGDVPLRLIQQVAFLARHVENRYHGIPQDIEWTYDGRVLWLLQARPVTTLLPIWTRKIAAEVIPGAIRPLTWSINRPLTCGVWGEIFTIVLGDRARGLDFNATADLHNSHAYFNASLLGQLFRRMGLPPESLEFLTRGERFSKPPLLSTLRNLPGLLRLLGRELSLERDFQRDDRQAFSSILTNLEQESLETLSPADLLDRCDRILYHLRRVTYYNIMAPLSFAIRQAVFRVRPEQLDNRDLPEVAAVRSLQNLADSVRPLLPADRTFDANALFDCLAQIPEGRETLQAFDRFLEQYGYLSEVGTDIAVPTWKEQPQPVRALFAQLVGSAQSSVLSSESSALSPQPSVQRRLQLKGQVATVYSKLMAHLRWCFVALERQWLAAEQLEAAGDIFYLEFDEIRQIITAGAFPLDIQTRIQTRRDRWEGDRQLENVPMLAYGNEPPLPVMQVGALNTSSEGDRRYRGIGASPGVVEGTVKVLRSLEYVPSLDRSTILVVPYTDAGWVPVLARVGGLIAEVGGSLSHGAIVAREYGIPAVMNLREASRLLSDGQRVRVDGQQGVVEIL